MRPLSFLIIALTFALTAIITLASFGYTAFNSLLTILFLLLLTRPPRAAFVWAVVSGLLIETISPFAPFSYLAALLITGYAARWFISSYVSHRTVWGALALTLAGSSVFEITLLITAGVGHFTASGWLPALSREYFIFVLQRVLWSTAVVGLVFAALQRLSPKARGVLVSTV